MHERQQRGVISSNPKSIYKYVTTLYEQALQHKLVEKIENIMKLDQPNNELVETLDNELGKAMKKADATCMHKYTEPFSEDILMARKKLKAHQLAISEKTLHMNFFAHINQIQRELLIPIDLSKSLEQLQKGKQKASKELNKIIKLLG